MTRIKIAINGFGRTGRNAFKIAWERSDVEVVAINDSASAQSLSYLLKHDSIYGEYGHEVSCENDELKINHKPVLLTRVDNPNWGEMGVDVVLDCGDSSGLLNHGTAQEKGAAHLQNGAKRVVVCGGGGNEDQIDTVILGVNDQKMADASLITSSADCTSHAAAVVLSVIESHFGVDKALVSSVHSYTSQQRLVDSPASQLKLSRGAAENIVPIKDATASVLTEVIPSLANKVSSMTTYVPTAIVSMVDISVSTKSGVSRESVNKAFRAMAENPYYQGILAVTSEDVVSSDLRGSSNSAVVDLNLTDAVGENMLRVVAWFDNEWGYANRLVELAAEIERISKK